MEQFKKYHQGNVFGVESQSIVIEYEIYEKGDPKQAVSKYIVSVYSKIGEGKQLILRNQVSDTKTIKKAHKIIKNLVEDRISQKKYQKGIMRSNYKTRLEIESFREETKRKEAEDFYSITKTALINDTDKRYLYCFEIGVPLIKGCDCHKSDLLKIELEGLIKKDLMTIDEMICDVIQKTN